MAPPTPEAYQSGLGSGLVDGGCYGLLAQAYVMVSPLKQVLRTSPVAPISLPSPRMHHTPHGVRCIRVIERRPP